MASDSLVLPCRKQRFAIEALLLDGLSRGVQGIWIRLSQAAVQVNEQRTDARGSVRFEALLGGSYELSLPDHDQDAWKLIRTETAPPPPAGVADIGWNAPSAIAPVRSSHKVRTGDCLASIAFQNGFPPETIWNDGANEPLRELRKNMHLLAVNDIVWIPERRVKSIVASTGVRYVLQMPQVPELLRVRFVTPSLKPRQGVPYLLQLSLADGTPLPDRTGSTDAEGFLVEPIPPNAWKGEIWLGKGQARELYPVQLGALWPAGELSGVLARLNNLGYRCENSSGLDEETRDALQQFQRDHQLEPTGEMDDATRAALAQIHLT